MQSELDKSGLSYKIKRRAKDPPSIYQKLVKDKSSIGDLKDLSGVRVNLDVTKSNFEEYYRVRDILKGNTNYRQVPGRFKDTIKNPLPNGYTGRLHDNFKDDDGVTHEVQIGSNDLEDFIGHKITMKDGKKISLHDLFYKGKDLGITVSPDLANEYKNLINKITQINGKGENLNSTLDAQEVQDFFRRVENSINEGGNPNENKD